MKMRYIAAIAAHIGGALFASAAATTTADVVIGSVVDAPHSLAKGSRQLQEISCVCSPRTYIFQLNFSGFCGVNTIKDNEGVKETSCVSSSLDDDTIPVEITSVETIELDDEFSPIAVEQIVGQWYDGGTFEYTSISNELNRGQPLEDQEQYAPGGIQITLIGRNAAGVVVVSVALWTYDRTNCVDEPIEENDAIGLIEVVEYTSAIPVFCDALETEPPTESPTEVETEPPTESPTEVETEPPTESPTEVETETPTKSPTMASMSYAASFSLAYAKAAKGKAYKAKAGKSSKNGELIRTRN